jgi:hypothetical protein
MTTTATNTGAEIRPSRDLPESGLGSHWPRQPLFSPLAYLASCPS